MTARLLALAVLIVLSACEAEPTADASATDPSTLTASGERPDTAMVREVTLEGTADLIGQNLNGVSPSVAIQTIDLWIERLDTASVENGAEIRDRLTTLRNQLQSYPLDGRAIGETLTGLAAQTDSADVEGRLRALTSALRTAGAQLAPPEPDRTAVADSAASDGA